MSYVPIVIPPTSDPPPSPRTRELAELLNKVVEEYAAAHPAVTRSEIQQAIRLTRMSTRGGNRPAAGVLVGVLAAVLAVGVLGLFMAGDRGGAGADEAMPMAVLAITVFLAVVLVAFKIRSR